MQTHLIVVGTDRAAAQGLAQERAVPLYDLNHLIVQGETVPIATIIIDEGLAQFHHIEAVYLESILRREPGVVLITAETVARNPSLLAGHAVHTPS